MSTPKPAAQPPVGDSTPPDPYRGEWVWVGWLLLALYTGIYAYMLGYHLLITTVAGHVQNGKPAYDPLGLLAQALACVPAAILLGFGWGFFARPPRMAASYGAIAAAASALYGLAVFQSHLLSYRDFRVLHPDAPPPPIDLHLLPLLALEAAALATAIAFCLSLWLSRWAQRWRSTIPAYAPPASPNPTTPRP